MRNRPTQQQWTVPGVGGGTFRIDAAFDEADQKTSLTYPGGNAGQSGEVVSYQYNAVGQLVSVSGLGGIQYVSSASYNAQGQITQLVNENGNPSAGSGQASANGLTRQWVYETNTLRLSTLQAGTAAPFENLQKLTYSYDNVGNITTLTDGTNSNQAQSFGYDWLNRLISASTNAAGVGQYDHAYSYDAVGNITSFAGNSYTYGDAAHKHAVTAAFGNSYAYDANGNQTSRTIGGVSYTFAYDYENRVTSITGSGVSTAFLYDADGVRVKKLHNGAATYTPFPHYEVSNGVVTRYYFFAGQRIAMKRDGVLTYLHADHLGSTVLETNTSGQIVSDQRYYAYGKQRDTGPVGTDHQFTGQKQDASGLIYMNARYYDPALGQFISPDTIVPNAGVLMDYNRYGYVRGNPLSYSDPSGHAACAAGDNPCWQNEWHWKNRWYTAHGFDWAPAASHWATSMQAQFADEGILQDTMSEAGIRFDSGLFGRWQWMRSEMELVGQAVVALGNKVGGMPRLHTLLGGGTTTFERNRIDGGSALAAMVGYGRLQIHGVYQNWISVFDNAFGNDDFSRGLTVHELAHVIDFNSPAGYKWLSSNIPPGRERFVGNYGRSGGSLEYFAEAVAMWTYNSVAPGSYRHARNSQGGVPLNIQQFLQANLVGVP